MAEFAIVTTAAPLTVTLDSGDVAIPALALGSYAPVDGHRVAVDRLGSQCVVLGTTDAKSVPTGSVTMFAGPVPGLPAGWLFCNGASLLRAGTYAALFAVIGTSYGSVDGTHFTVPDTWQKFPRCDTPGVIGGANTHTLTVAELPAHDHGLSQIKYNNVTAPAGGQPTFGSPGQATTQRTDGTGSGNAHNNMPAYLGFNFIIKF